VLRRGGARFLKREQLLQIQVIGVGQRRHNESSAQ
jgi:hypothetical protein